MNKPAPRTIKHTMTITLTDAEHGFLAGHAVRHGMMMHEAMKLLFLSSVASLMAEESRKAKVPS